MTHEKYFTQILFYLSYYNYCYYYYYNVYC